MKITSVLFVDPSVDCYEILLKNVLAGIQAIVLDPDGDGVTQITQVLSQYDDVETVHIVSHGSSGTLYLGNGELSLGTLAHYADGLKNWFSQRSALSFSESPTLYLYGCHVAAGDAGTEFITKLHHLTGANVAASANLTGNAFLGGDWNLEVSIGNTFERVLAFPKEVIAAYPSVLVAPTLIDSDIILNPINNNAGQPVGSIGTPIFSIVNLGSNVTDPDSGTTGIAIVNANIENGNFFYTIDNGVTWTPLGAVSDSNARLLASNSVTRIYYQPNPGSSGLIENLFAFRAWDQTLGSGTNGGVANTTVNGGDTAFSSEADVAAITVNAVNNAPTLANTNVTLLPVNEDPGELIGNVGTLVSNLVTLGGNVTDPDPNAVTGIAVTGANTANGTWFYSVDDGNSWSNLGVVSNVEARLLAADGGTRIYFQPSPNFNGSVTPALTFRAWDQTGTLENINGSVFNTTISGGSTAFSTTTANAVITVTPVNDAPTLNEAQVVFPAINNNIGVPLGAVGTLVSSLARLGDNVIDPDINAVTGIAVINADNSNGIWFYSSDNGSNWIPLGLVSETNARLLAANPSTRLYFLPNAGFNGTVDNVLTFRAWDQTIGTNGGSADTTPPSDVTTSAFSSTINTATITVNAGNNAPILSDTTISLSINENLDLPTGAVGTLVSSLVAIGTNVTDPDLNAVTGVAIVGANTTSGNWFYSTNNGDTWSPLGAVSNTEARLLAADGGTRLYFQPIANFNGTINDALTILAWDQSTGTNGSTASVAVSGGISAFSSTTDTVAITVNGVNDAPILLDTNVLLTAVNSNTGTPVGAVGTLVSSLVSLGGNVTDPDQNALTGIAITGANTTNGSFFYSLNNGTDWTPLGVVSDTNARLIAADPNSRIYFQPNANFTGTINDALTFRAWDQSTGTNGGIANTTVNGSTTAFSTAIDTAAITVTDINNAPVLSDINVILSAVNQDAGTPTGAVGTLVSSLVGFGSNVTDPDLNALTGIAVTSANTTNGSFFYSIDNGNNWIPLGVVSEANARLIAADPNSRIYFQPNANFTGVINDALTFRAWDQSTGTNGGIANTTVNGSTTAFSTAIDTAAITVTDINNAPVLSDINVILSAVNQGAGTPTGAVGTLVSSLVGFGSNVTDPDLNALTGIAVTSANNASGSLFYSIDNGSNWTPLGAVSNTNARLLAADPNTRIYFQPSVNFTGTINDVLTFRAWDQTTGVNGNVADTTVNGGISSFSTAIDTAAITVNSNNAVNEIPNNAGNDIPNNASNDIPNNAGNNAFVLRRLSNNLFQLDGSSGSDKPKLEVALAGRNSQSVNELGVFFVDDDQGTINGIAPGSDNYARAAISRATAVFSAIAKVPNGFSNNDIKRLQEFNSGSRLQFFLVRNSSIDAVQAGLTPLSDVLFPNSLNQRVVDSGNGEFTLSWNSESNSSASSFQDLEVKIRATNQPLPLGSGIQGNPSGEIIDLSNVSTQVRAEFIANREALFDNVIGFYQIADVNGGIDTDGNGTIDFRPGDAGYTQAAVRGRVAGIDLTTGNQGTATLTGTLSPNSLFAPFMIVNGRPEAVLDDLSSNDPTVYFAFLGANTDKADHVRLLSNNTFGFEDLQNTGDRDYNDMIVRINLSIA
jgi:hypothetical protein